MTTQRADAEIRIKVRDDASKQLKDVGRKLESVGKSLGPLGVIGGAFAGGAAIQGTVMAMESFVRTAVGLVQSASNLTESVNAVEVVFGNASDTILEFGATASKTAGIAASDFNQMASVTGSLLLQTGVSAEQAASQTNMLAQRAADMASVFNTDVKDALTAINAALRGETEPIRRYAVDVTDATLQTFALSQGITKSVSAMDQQEKGALRLQAVLSQTARVEGDFANTAENLANRTRSLSADFENLKADLGQGLIPVATAVVGMFQNMTDDVSTFIRVFKDFREQVRTPLSERDIPAEGGSFFDGLNRFFEPSEAEQRAWQAKQAKQLETIMAQRGLRFAAPTPFLGDEGADPRVDEIIQARILQAERLKGTDTTIASATEQLARYARGWDGAANALDSFNDPLVETRHEIFELNTPLGRANALLAENAERVRQSEIATARANKQFGEYLGSIIAFGGGLFNTALPAIADTEIAQVALFNQTLDNIAATREWQDAVVTLRENGIDPIGMSFEKVTAQASEFTDTAEDFVEVTRAIVGGIDLTTNSIDELSKAFFDNARGSIVMTAQIDEFLGRLNELQVIQDNLNRYPLAGGPPPIPQAVDSEGNLIGGFRAGSAGFVSAEEFAERLAFTQQNHKGDVTFVGGEVFLDGEKIGELMAEGSSEGT